MSIDHQLVMITGAGAGIGAHLAHAFAARGAHVLLCDTQLENVQQVAYSITQQGGKASAYYLDVSNFKATQIFSEQVQKEHGSIHVLINNAGVSGRSTETDLDALWDHVIQVNLYGMRNMSLAFTQALKETKGNIVNFASIASFKSVGTSSPAYIASKAAIAAHTKTLARDLGKYHIRVNAVAPGVINTEMLAPQREKKDGLDWFIAHNPLRRIGEPNEVCGPVLFLASPEASFVNGVTLPVDGGFLVT